MRTLRASAAALLLFTLSIGCDGAGDAPAPAPAPAKTPPPAEPPAAAAVAPAEKKVELPWKPEAIRDALRGGVTLVYKQTGTNAKGKPVEDDYRCEVKKASTTEVGTVCDGVRHPSDDPGATQVAMQPWSHYGPFFAVERPEKTLVERGALTVPAGTFDCVQVELKGFFGDSLTVWMIADKPGIYAKVLRHPNTSVEGDKTELVFELAELTIGAG